MIANTIVAGGSSQSCSRMPATSPSQGGNVDDQNLCEFTASTDHPSTDPQLGALQNNGGPTDTQLPPVASPPIDAGVDAACPATDQRGVPRPQGPHCDSGAVERTKPTAGSPTVSNMTATGASVTATANPVFLGGSYVYNYGTSTAYGQSTASAQLQAGVGAQPAPATLAGLTPGTAVSPAASGHHARWHCCLIGCDVYHPVHPVRAAAAASPRSPACGSPPRASRSRGAESTAAA